MKTLILTIVITVVIFIVPSRSESDEPDNKKHFTVSVPCGIIGVVMIEECCSDWPWYYKIPAATGIGMIPGIAKEVVDQINYGGWDNKDLVADGLGSLTGVGLYFTFKW